MANKQIALTRGEVAVVDDGDYLLLSQFKWHCHITPSGLMYARRGERQVDGRSRGLYMHRVIMSEVAQDRKVDHRNGNGLDNRRDNLRVATHGQNIQNGKMRTNNVSGYKGVWYDQQKKTFRAQVGVDGRRFSLGSFSTPEAAYSAYCVAAAELHGEYARTEGRIAQPVGNLNSARQIQIALDL